MPLFNTKDKRPSTTHGRCVTCGKPRAAIVYNPKLKQFIHQACKDECDRENAARNRGGK